MFRETVLTTSVKFRFEKELRKFYDRSVFSNCPDSIDLTRIQRFYILPDSSRFDRLEGISRSKLRITVDEKEWMIYGYSGISRQVEVEAVVGPH